MRPPAHSLWRTARRGAALPTLALAAWIGVAWLCHGRSALFVTPGDVGAEALRLLADTNLYQALAASLARATAGFLLGGALGLSAGIGLGLSRSLRLTLDPTLQTLKNISLFAWMPLVMAWFGITEAARIALVALACFFPMFLNGLEGVRSVPRHWVELGRAFRYSRSQLIRRIILPAATPSIFTGVHLALIYAWLATLGAEYMLTSGSGLGNLLSDAREDLRVDRILAYMGVAGAVGYLLSTLAARIERSLTPYHPASASMGGAII